MSDKPRSTWDPETLLSIRIVGDRRYRRRLGTASLTLLGILAGIGTWGIDFRERTPLFFLAYWGAVLLVFCATMGIALLDMWSIRLEFALKRRELAQEFVQHARALAAPRNGKPTRPKPPRL